MLGARRTRSRRTTSSSDCRTLRAAPHERPPHFASMMIAAGVNAKALSGYLGHANIAITFDRYGHLMPGSEAEARDQLNAYLDR